MERKSAAQIENDLAHFTGSATFTRLGPIYPEIIISEGVLFLAKEASAFWLPEAIASHIVTNKELRELSQGLMFWRLDVTRDGDGRASAVLTARKDTGLPALVTQEIEYTDFPLEGIDIWAGSNGEGYTLYLPSEH